MSDELSTASFSVRDEAKPQTSGKMRRRHSVDFAGGERLHKVVEYEGVDEEERGEVWYQREEYDIIKSRNSLIVKMMKAGSFEESEEHTFRGLEHKLKEGFKIRRNNKFNALNAVLEEQDRQYDRGQVDQEVIAKAYRRVSLNAKESAFVLATCDAQESYCYDGSNPVSRRRSLGDRLEDEDDDDNDEDVADGDDETDMDTICSEDSKKKKTRLRRLFGGVSRSRKEGGMMNRRGSL